MALADVFDALSNKRVYKPAFSLVETLDIIKQSSGTHFDPKVVDAFIMGIDQVKVTYEQYKEI